MILPTKGITKVLIILRLSIQAGPALVLFANLGRQVSSGLGPFYPFFPHSQQPLSALSSAYLLWFPFVANNMDPDQTAPCRSSLIRVHSVCFHGNSLLVCIGIYAAKVISRQHFRTRNIGRIMVKKYGQYCIALFSKINPFHSVRWIFPYILI